MFLFFLFCFTVDCSIDMFGLSIVLMELYLCGNSSPRALPGDNNYALFQGASEEAQLRLYGSVLDYSKPDLDTDSAALSDLLMSAAKSLANSTQAHMPAEPSDRGALMHGKMFDGGDVAWCTIPVSMLEASSAVKRNLWFETRPMQQCSHPEGDVQVDLVDVACWRHPEGSLLAYSANVSTGAPGRAPPGAGSGMQFQPLSTFIAAKKRRAMLWLHRCTLREDTLISGGCASPGDTHSNSSYASPSLSPELKRGARTLQQPNLSTSHEVCQFVSFLELLFTWSPQNRVSPATAARHPWVSSAKSNHY